MAETTAVTCDSTAYRQTFYGILNAAGDFWTPLAFDSKDAAREHIARFWATSPSMRANCLREFRIVPVRIQLTALPEDPNG